MTRKASVRGKDRGRIIRSLVERDGWACGFCGGEIDPAIKSGHSQLSVDHKQPRAEGGSNRLENLRLAHAGCNNEAGGTRTRPGLIPEELTDWQVDRLMLLGEVFFLRRGKRLIQIVQRKQDVLVAVMHHGKIVHEATVAEVPERVRRAAVDL